MNAISGLFTTLFAKLLKFIYKQLIYKTTLDGVYRNACKSKVDILKHVLISLQNYLKVKNK